MQRVAFRQLGKWISSVVDDLRGDVGNLLEFGGISFAFVFGGWLLQVGFASAARRLFLEEWVGNVVATGLSLLVGAGVYTGLTGFAVARRHLRPAGWPDFVQDAATHVQSLLAQLFTKGVLALLVAAPVVVAVVPLMALGGDPVVGLAGAVVGGLISIVLGFFLAPLVLFAVPLVVEERMDFFSAIRTSIDCVRRDWLGLAVYHAIAQLVRLPGLLCPLFVFVTEPVFHLLVLRAYQEYFDLEDDRYVPPYLAPLILPPEATAEPEPLPYWGPGAFRPGGAQAGRGFEGVGGVEPAPGAFPFAPKAPPGASSPPVREAAPDETR
jgi:hypothetical protein